MSEQNPSDNGLLQLVQVNAPFDLLVEKYLDVFLYHRVNPEIGFSAAVLDEVDHKRLQFVADLLARHGLTTTVHGPFMDLAPGGLDEEVRQVSRRRFHRLLDLAPIFEPKAIVFHAGYDDRRYHEHRSRWLENSITTWEPLVARAEKLRVPIQLENTYEETPEMILAVLEKISSDYFGFCFDIGHQHVFARAPLAEWLDCLGDYLGHVHLHDNDGRCDSHQAIGDGSAPFHELFQYLGNNNRRPVITLEPHAEENLWLSLQSLRELWPWELTGPA
ncbi:MAG: sugar phosphate isomerase/epimerase [Deltaproteobacteria bacterium]|nr:sugar phosphate isomerase/epimerase [Deltaproteobacteria bacterium]MBW2071685.1 sugar phosphate isomerase/epimerase [Deltaproteobacteria bacterium]